MFKQVIITILLVIISTVSLAGNSDIEFHVGLHTYHFVPAYNADGSEYDLNEDNEFLRVSLGVLDLSTFDNSFRRRSWTVGLSWTWEPTSKIDITGRWGLMTGYTEEDIKAPIELCNANDICMYGAASIAYDMGRGFHAETTFLGNNVMMSGIAYKFDVNDIYIPDRIQ